MRALLRTGRRRNPRLGALVAAVGILAACAPGVSYRPSDWRHAGPYRWAWTAEGLDIEMSELGGPAGSRRLALQLTIHNASLSAVVVAGGWIETGAGSFGSDPVSREEQGLGTVAPGETRRVSMQFRLDRAVGETLIEPVTLTLTLRTSSGPRRVPIPMRRS